MPGPVGGAARVERPSTTAYLRFLADLPRSGNGFHQFLRMAAPARDMAVRTLMNRNTYLTRPDLGAATLRRPCKRCGALQTRSAGADRAVRRLEHGCRARQYGRIVPPLTNGAEAGQVLVERSVVPLLGRSGRTVWVSHRLRRGTDVVGERPGLGQSESMKRYAVYRPGGDGSRIVRSLQHPHREGTPPVETAAVTSLTCTSR